MVGVVSEPGQGGKEIRQVSAGETNVSEPLGTCRKRTDVIETGLSSMARDKLGGCLLTARVVTGTEAA